MMATALGLAGAARIDWGQKGLYDQSRTPRPGAGFHRPRRWPPAVFRPV